MQDFANAAGMWWSYAEGDSTLLGGVAAVLLIAAAAFVGTRVLSHVRRRR
jgi:hypothetical protein